MAKTAIVILNWNGKNFLNKFLPSVILYSAGYADVIVADNASTDDSIAFLKENFPQIRIIQNASNGGFAKGYNDALAQVDAKYYILLNSDIEVTENWIAPVIELLDNNPEVIAPLDKLRGMLGSASSDVNVSGTFRVQGTDLLLVLEKAQKSRGRAAGSRCPT